MSDIYQMLVMHKAHGGKASLLKLRNRFINPQSKDDDSVALSALFLFWVR